MLAAALQFRPVRRELEHNRQRLLLLIDAAVEAGADFLVLPEMCTSGYVFHSREEIRPYCEDREGRSVKLFSKVAQQHGVTICFGWPEVDIDSGVLYNSAAICLPDGDNLFYRKTLLFEADIPWATPGDTPYPVWESKGGLRCTLGICMDLNDDKFLEHLIQSEARVLAFPTNWLDQGLKVWNYWAWKLDGTKACMIASNRYGEEDGIPFCGDSAILDGRTVLGWLEERCDGMALAKIPPQPTVFVERKT